MEKPWETYQKADQQANPVLAQQELRPWDKYKQLDNQQAPDMAWSEVGKQAIRNLPSSTLGVAKGVVNSFMHPIDTTQGVLDLGNAAMQKMLPDYINNLMPDKTQANPAKLDSAVDFYKNRYGSSEGFKNSLANDPAGVMADASTVLTGGGAIASKLPMIEKVGNITQSFGRAIDPLVLASRTAPATGRGLANIVGGIGTHTGGDGLKIAAKAGMEGGEMSKNFLDNLRGNVPMTDVLNKVKQNIQAMGSAKAAEYRNGMADISGDKTILDFNGIDNALADSFNKITFKGQAKNSKAMDVHNKIVDEINLWKSLDPAEFHTPEGLDALKQRIGGIQESIPFEEKTARMAAGNVYTAIKNDISKQAPVYAKTMSNYSDASQLVNEIERTLSLNGSASVDTSMRKLQSLMRNNVNTNYGNRLNLAKKLEQQGGNEFMSSLAGQSLNSWTPRGLGGAVMGLTGFGGNALGGPLLALPTLAVQSPRLMGEAAHKVGLIGSLPYKASVKLNDWADYAGTTPGLLSNTLYQGNQLNQNKQKK